MAGNFRTSASGVMGTLENRAEGIAGVVGAIGNRAKGMAAGGDDSRNITGVVATVVGIPRGTAGVSHRLSGIYPVNLPYGSTTVTVVSVDLRGGSTTVAMTPVILRGIPMTPVHAFRNFTVGIFDKNGGVRTGSRGSATAATALRHFTARPPDSRGRPRKGVPCERCLCRARARARVRPGASMTLQTEGCIANARVGHVVPKRRGDRL